MLVACIPSVCSLSSRAHPFISSVARSVGAQSELDWAVFHAKAQPGPGGHEVDRDLDAWTTHNSLSNAQIAVRMALRKSGAGCTSILLFQFLSDVLGETIRRVVFTGHVHHPDPQVAGNGERSNAPEFEFESG